MRKRAIPATTRERCGRRSNDDGGGPLRSRWEAGWERRAAQRQDHDQRSRPRSGAAIDRVLSRAGDDLDRRRATDRARRQRSALRSAMPWIASPRSGSRAHGARTADLRSLMSRLVKHARGSAGWEHLKAWRTESTRAQPCPEKLLASRLHVKKAALLASAASAVSTDYRTW